MNHTNEDSSRDTNQKKAPAIRKITRSGSLAIVNKNKEMAGPNAMNVQPKKTAAVILGLGSKPRRNKINRTKQLTRLVLLFVVKMALFLSDDDVATRLLAN